MLVKKNLLLLFLIVNSQTIFSQYKLVEKDAIASCISYTVNDINGDILNLPEKFQEVLDCPSMINIRANILTYELNGVRQYNLDSGTDKLLFVNYDDIDGCSGPVWSAKGEKVMFVVINQQMKHNYKAMCRIIVLTLDDKGDVKKKQKFDRNVNFSCGSICTSVPGEDFYFKDESTIVYKVHSIDEVEPIEKEISLE